MKISGCLLNILIYHLINQGEYSSTLWIQGNLQQLSVTCMSSMFTVTSVIFLRMEDLVIPPSHIRFFKKRYTKVRLLKRK